MESDGSHAHARPNTGKYLGHCLGLLNCHEVGVLAGLVSCSLLQIVEGFQIMLLLPDRILSERSKT